METVVSGIRPTGNLHLGNYFGAVKGFLQMQHEYNCLFFIADWHSLTTHPHPENIQNSVKTILSEYLACGIDPDVATIYVQSDVPEVVELYLYLNMNAGIGELMRTTSFKDKARQQLHIDRVHTTEGDVEREIFNEGNKHSAISSPNPRRSIIPTRLSKSPAWTAPARWARAKETLFTSSTTRKPSRKR